MIARVTLLLFFVALATCSRAERVRVKFEASLVEANPAFVNPASSLRGYYEFDEPEMLLITPSTAGQQWRIDVREFVVESQLGTFSQPTGRISGWRIDGALPEVVASWTVSTEGTSASPSTSAFFRAQRQRVAFDVAGVKSSTDMLVPLLSFATDSSALDLIAPTTIAHANLIVSELQETQDALDYLARNSEPALLPELPRARESVTEAWQLATDLRANLLALIDQDLGEPMPAGALAREFTALSKSLPATQRLLDEIGVLEIQTTLHDLPQADLNNNGRAGEQLIRADIDGDGTIRSDEIVGVGPNPNNERQFPTETLVSPSPSIAIGFTPNDALQAIQQVIDENRVPSPSLDELSSARLIVGHFEPANAWFGSPSPSSFTLWTLEYEITNLRVVAVPEPQSLLLAAGVLGIANLSRRCRR